MLNYVIFYVVYENDRCIDVINILPSRSKRQRVWDNERIDLLPNSWVRTLESRPLWTAFSH